MRSLIAVFSMLTSRERRVGWGVFTLILLTAILEALGVASVMPFLAVLADPEVIHEQPALNWLYGFLGVDSVHDFLFWVGGLVFGVIALTAVVRTVTQYVVNRYVQMRRYTLSRRLLATYLGQPYEFFLGRHSGDMSSRVLSETDLLVNNVLQPALQGLAAAVVAVAIVALLFVIDPTVAVAVAVIIGGTYALTYYLIRNLLSRLGRERSQANDRRFHAASEAMAGIKPIKLSGSEDVYLQSYDRPAHAFSRLQASEITLSQVPRYVIEAIGIGGVIVLAMILISTTGGIGETLPMLGLYAFAGYRLLPAAQYVYAAGARLRFGAAAIERVRTDLAMRVPAEPRQAEAVEFRDHLSLSGVGYRHPGAMTPALIGVDLTISRGACVGIVGATGAGKSTLVDLLLGLLDPTEGGIHIDGHAFSTERKAGWQRLVGYVPQEIFLLDGSIRENIALGVPTDEVDDDRVERSARMAHLHAFVTESLADGYETSVGERGVRLSGGQRQRVGIARALYRRPDVLVLDEATSALDSRTERAVMESIGALHGEITVVMIAHRLSTLDACDQIVWLDNGRVRDVGGPALLERLKTENGG